MKKTLSAFLLLMLIFNLRVLGIAVYDVSPQARYAFKKDYPQALHATWNQVDNESIYAVRFVDRNEAAVVYYDEEGSKIAVARLVKLSALPVKLKNRINDLCKEEEIKGIQELVMYNKTCFFVETEHKGIKRSIGLNSNGHLFSRRYH